MARQSFSVIETINFSTTFSHEIYIESMCLTIRAPQGCSSCIICTGIVFTRWPYTLYIYAPLYGEKAARIMSSAPTYNNFEAISELKITAFPFNVSLPSLWDKFVSLNFPCTLSQFSCCMLPCIIPRIFSKGLHIMPCIDSNPMVLNLPSKIQ